MGIKNDGKRHKGAELSNSGRAAILYARLVLETKLQKIASDFGCVPITITNIIKRFIELGTTESRKRSGRP
jgi:hypothetical protein